MGKLPEITLEEIAQRLKRKKKIYEPPTLFLGSRTGWYYGHEKFYEEIKSFSHVATAFNNYTDAEKFRECYKVLQDKRRFNPGLIDEILRSYLEQSIKPRNADICLAEMIFEGYFDVIISTTIDSLLQAGLQHCRSWGETLAFENKLFILPVHSFESIQREERQATKTIKVFGDLETSRNYYTAQHELNLDSKEQSDLKAYLWKVLERPTVMIGFDPIWDQPMVKAFSTEGRDIIYINEDELDEESEMARVIQERDGRWLIGQKWGYARLMGILHKELFSQEPLSFALARKLSEQLESVQKNITELQQKSHDSVESLSHIRQTLQDDVRGLHEQMAWLQKALQQLLEAQNIEKRKDN